MLNRVYNWVKENNLINSGDTVVCAVSGGVDSLVMLHILNAIKHKLGINVVAAHFNHHIRAEESDRDQEFTREFCEKLGVEFHVGHGDIMGRVSETHESVEEAARVLRYEFLENIIPGAKVATAHHSDDNLETMLMNIIRGCGSTGICGIPPRRGNIIRPVMCMSRKDIEEYAERNGIEFVTDSTNLTDDYLRNRVRHNIIPLMKAENTKVNENALDTAVAIRTDNEYLNKLADKEFNKLTVVAGEYMIDCIDELDECIKSRVIMRILSANGIETSKSNINKFRDAIKTTTGGVITNFSNRKSSVVSCGYIRFVDTETIENQNNPVIESTVITTGENKVYSNDTEYNIKVTDVDCVDTIYRDGMNLIVKADSISGDIIVRSAQAGDKIKMPGGTKQVCKVLKDKGFYREERMKVPVICDDTGVIAIVGVGIDMNRSVEIGDKAIQFSVVTRR